MGSTPLPGVKRRAEDRLRRTRPVNGPALGSIPQRGPGEKPRQRAFSLGAKPGARASRPQKSGQDARAPQRKRPNAAHSDDARSRAFAAAGGLRPGIHAGYSQDNATARGPLTGPLAGGKRRSAGVPPATTNAGKMPALQRGSGLNAATATTPVNGRLPPQAVFGPAFMPGISRATARPEAR